MYKNFMRFLLTFAFCCVILGLDVQAYQDKIAHGVTSFTISNLTYVICSNHFDELDKKECILTALIVSFSAGMIKEGIIDNEPSWGDTLANSVGIGLSIPLFIYEY